MSLHVHLERTEWRGEGDDRAYVVWAECECGWRGEDHSHDLHRDHDGARREYREHVEGELGASAYYSCGVQCRNCGSAHEQPVVVGTPVYQARCSRCGQRMLDPRNDAWQESRDAMKGWLS